MNSKKNDMKFLHVSDVHLDSCPVGLKRFYGQATLSISELIQKSLICCIDLALKEAVDFIVITGDLFDSNWKDYSVGLFFIEQMKRLNCPVYYIRGNHDSENRLVKSLPYPSNVHVFKSDSAHTYVDKTLKVAIHGQSYMHFELKEDIASLYPPALEGYFNIGLLHTSGPLSSLDDTYAPYDEKLLLNKGYDYWALGHLHQHQIIHTSPWIVYSGCLQGRHIRETGQHGCCLVSIEDQIIQQVDFFPVNKGVWHHVKVDLSSVVSTPNLKTIFLSQVESVLKKSKHIVTILRLELTGINSFDRSIALDNEKWVHKFHCWLSESFEETIYIERLVDSSREPASEHKLNLFTLDVLQSMRTLEMKAWMNNSLKTELESIKSSMPTNIAELDMFEELQMELIEGGLYGQLIRDVEQQFIEVQS